MAVTIGGQLCAQRSGTVFNDTHFFCSTPPTPSIEGTFPVRYAQLLRLHRHQCAATYAHRVSARHGLSVIPSYILSTAPQSARSVSLHTAHATLLNRACDRAMPPNAKAPSPQLLPRSAELRLRIAALTPSIM
jgi:hypothetical protein